MNFPQEESATGFAQDEATYRDTHSWRFTKMNKVTKLIELLDLALKAFELWERLQPIWQIMRKS